MELLAGNKDKDKAFTNMTGIKKIAKQWAINLVIC